MYIGADPIHSGSGIRMSDTTLGLLAGGFVVFVVVCIAVVIIKRTLRRRRKRHAIRYGAYANSMSRQSNIMNRSLVKYCVEIGNDGDSMTDYWQLYGTVLRHANGVDYY